VVHTRRRSNAAVSGRGERMRASGPLHRVVGQSRCATSKKVGAGSTRARQRFGQWER
jgi:hypothetical protein